MSWLLPPPVTFEDGQRKLYGWLMAAAGVAYSVSVLCGVGFVVMGTWPADLDRVRLYILAGSIAGGSLGSIAVTLALAVGGPVGRFTAKGSKDGFELGAEKAPASSSTTTTTTSELKP